MISVFREQFSGNSKSNIQHSKFCATRMLGLERQEIEGDLREQLKIELQSKKNNISTFLRV
jgi:hypothetical protein